MAKRTLSLSASERRTDAAVRRMSPSVEKWIEKVTAHYLRRFRTKGWSILKKADKEDQLDKEIERLLALFGSKEQEAAAKGAARAFGGKWSRPPEWFAKYLDGKRGMGKKIRGNLKQEILRLLREAAKETPRPTISEVARRIRTGTTLQGAPVGVSTAVRAERIARTELGTAAEEGIFDGINAVADEGDLIEWLARTQDGRSGKRRHYEMNDHPPVLVSDLAGNDPSKWFLTPLGNRCRFPKDPRLPLEDRINCRCTQALRLARKGNRK